MKIKKLTLQPFHLRSSFLHAILKMIAELLVVSRCAVFFFSDHLISNVALILFADVNPHESKLRGLRWIRILNCEINRIFGDFTLRLAWRLPGEVS